MTLSLLDDRRYDMPASFGPSMVPHRTSIARAESLVLSARTDAVAARALIPAHFDVPQEPTLTVAHMAYHDVDYLGGRSYNELVVSVGAGFGAADARIDAALALILWVDQPGALIAGREFMGLPKLMGRIPPLETRDGGDLAFTCSEYDAPLVEGQATNLNPLDAARLERLNARAGEVRTFGWKYLPAPQPAGGADLDYPVLNVMRWDYREAWTGTGRFAFLPASRRDAPLSAGAIEALSALPIVGDVRAFRGVGSAVIDRTATRRLAASD